LLFSHSEQKKNMRCFYVPSVFRSIFMTIPETPGKPDEEHFDDILNAITGSGALEYTRLKAEQASQRAISCLDHLPEGVHKTALMQLAKFAVERNH
jgi:geranylgeranyl pyrophosphate synthase